MRFSLSDSTIADMQTTLIEQMTTAGKHTPTTYLSGRCTANSGTIPCHFKKGNTLTYGTGPVRTGTCRSRSSDARPDHQSDRGG